MLTQFLHFVLLHLAQTYAPSKACLAGSLSSKQKILASMIAFASRLIMKRVLRSLTDADGMFLSKFTTQMCYTQVILALRHKAVCA